MNKKAPIDVGAFCLERKCRRVGLQNWFGKGFRVIYLEVSD